MVSDRSVKLAGLFLGAVLTAIAAALWIVVQAPVPASSHGSVNILECTAPQVSGDNAANRGIQFTVDQSFVAIEVGLDAGADTYDFDAELRRSSGFLGAAEASVHMSGVSTGTAHIDFPAEIPVSGSETFTLKFANVTGPSAMFIQQTGLGNTPCPGVTETEENDVANPTDRMVDPTPFRVLGLPQTPTPTPSPTPSASPTPSETATPSATPTTTATATATASPTPTTSPGVTLAWGDDDCDGDVDSVDGLKDLRYVAGLPVQQTEPCPDLGSQVGIAAASAHQWGDVDCDGDVDSVDGLKILRFVAGLPVTGPPPCPDIGTPVNVMPPT
jgi:hypothetical protein